MSQTALIVPRRLEPAEIGTIPIYSPGPGQLLIKIHAAALNPADWILQKSPIVTDFPAVLGLDRAGEVVEIGEGVNDFQKGDRVVTLSGYENQYQAFQQYGLADAHVTSKIPATITYDKAATIPLTFSVALSGLFAEFPHGAGLPATLSLNAPEVGASRSILVIGGASSVGQFAIQLAKMAGFSTVIATASLKNESLLRSLGATHVLDRCLDAPALIAAISAIPSNKSPELVFDSIGHPETEELGIAVAAHWQTKTTQECLLVSVNPMPSAIVTAQTTVKVANVVAGPHDPWNLELFNAVFHDNLCDWLENGVIKANRVEVVPGGLASIPAALKRLERGEVSGHKLVAHPQEGILN